MNSNQNLEVKSYLNRFDQILSDMAKKMLSSSVTNNITLNFIRCMIPHHQAAILMCENLLRYTKNSSLRQISQQIITTQTRGINQMMEIARTTSGYTNQEIDVIRYMAQYYEIFYHMVDCMSTSVRTNNIDLDFTSEMIPHHEGAILMCENLLKYQIDPRLRTVAVNIIQEQSQGVRQLKIIRRSLLP